jgi:hypothetical protein
LKKACPRVLEEADRDHHAQLPGQRGKARHQRVPLQRLRQVEILRMLFDAEIGGGEQLLDQHHLRALRRGLAHQRLGPVGIGGQVPAAGELGGGDGDGSHNGGLIGRGFAAA